MIKVVTGNEAAAYGAALCRPEIICSYPITPQSQIPEKLSELCADGYMKGKFINVESEMAALGYVIGAASGGVRVFTATSSQGLAWMHEGLHWAAGANLPIVMVNVNRVLAAPWSIDCSQIDSLSQRDTGWIQLYCESNQEVLDTIIQAYRVSELLSLPSMICMDGVYLSYILENVEIPDQEKVDRYLPPYRPMASHRQKLNYRLYEQQAPEPGGYLEKNHMGQRYEQHKRETKSIKAFMEADIEFQAFFGRSYPPVEEYKCDDADIVLIVAGSTAGTSRGVIDKLRAKGQKVGLVKFKMFRPFPRTLIRKALSGKKKIAVIDRDISPGQCGIFCQEIKWALYSNSSHEFIPLFGFVSGLGGSDITPRLIEKALEFTMEKKLPPDEVIWLGLEEKENPDDYDRNIIKIR